MHMHIILL